MRFNEWNNAAEHLQCAHKQQIIEMNIVFDLIYTDLSPEIEQYPSVVLSKRHHIIHIHHYPKI